MYKTNRHAAQGVVAPGCAWAHLGIHKKGATVSSTAFLKRSQLNNFNLCCVFSV